MARSRRKRLPKTTGEWEALDTQQVMERVFGKRGQKALQREAKRATRKPKRD